MVLHTFVNGPDAVGTLLIVGENHEAEAINISFIFVDDLVAIDLWEVEDSTDMFVTFIYLFSRTIEIIDFFVGTGIPLMVVQVFRGL